MKQDKEEYIQICPKCGSPDIEVDFTNAAAVSAGFIGQVKKCNYCGHTGKFFPEVPISKVKKLKEKNEIKGKTFIDKTYVSGVIGLWKIIGIIAILFSVAMLFIDSARSIGFYFLLLGILLTIYGFLRDEYKNKLFMKIIGLIIILYLAVGGFVLLAFS